MLGCDKVVVFGDGSNDVDMFRTADESYATANACDELKQIATEIIGSNDDNAVAEWLLYRCSQEVLPNYSSRFSLRTISYEERLALADAKEPGIAEDNAGINETNWREYTKTKSTLYLLRRKPCNDK